MRQPRLQSGQFVDFSVIGKQAVYFFLHVGNLRIHGAAKPLLLKGKKGFFYQFTVSCGKLRKAVKAFISEYSFHAGMIPDMAGKAAVFRQEKGAVFPFPGGNG